MNKWLAVLTASACVAVFLWFFGYFMSVAVHLSFEHWNPLKWEAPWRGINAIIWFIATAIFMGAATNE